MGWRHWACWMPLWLTHSSSELWCVPARPLWQPISWRLRSIHNCPNRAATGVQLKTSSTPGGWNFCRMPKVGLVCWGGICRGEAGDFPHHWFSSPPLLVWNLPSQPGKPTFPVTGLGWQKIDVKMNRNANLYSLGVDMAQKIFALLAVTKSPNLHCYITSLIYEKLI